MTDPAAQYDPYAQQPAYAPPPVPGQGGGAPGGRYVPPTLDEVWYKTTPNILLYIVTCGIWGAAWSYRTHDDLQKHNGEGLGGTVGLVLGLIFPLAICFTVPMEIEKSYQRNGWPSPVTATDGLWMLIPFVGPFIWYPKIQSALNSYWTSQGSQAPAA
jgi:hypothetical protein